MEGNTIVKSFELKGVQLKDIDTGLVDFPAIWNGHEVLLCWRQGEDSITHYHGMEDGFAGRKSLPKNNRGLHEEDLGVCQAYE